MSAPTLFDGVTFDHALDRDRLHTALGQIWAALQDHEWHTLPELAHLATCSEAGASARLRDLRKLQWGHHTILRRRVSGGRWQYRLG